MISWECYKHHIYSPLHYNYDRIVSGGTIISGNGVCGVNYYKQFAVHADRITPYTFFSPWFNLPYTRCVFFYTTAVFHGVGQSQSTHYMYLYIKIYVSISHLVRKEGSKTLNLIKRDSLNRISPWPLHIEIMITQNCDKSWNKPLYEYFNISHKNTK